jgi:hypothetical protein
MNFSLAMDGSGDDYENVRRQRVHAESSTRTGAIRRDELPLVLGRAEARPSKGFGGMPKPNRCDDLYPIDDECLLLLKQSRLAFQSQSIGLIAS